jgi:enoyl-CoA hydratase
VDYERYHDDHHIRVEIQDRVAVVTLDRPEKRNAINHALHVGLERVWRDLAHDPEVGAIVLTGAGKAFCAGGDVTGFAPEEPIPLEQMRGGRYLVQEMLNCEAPMVAAVNGPAAGLGATIALLCDVIFMGESARIGDTHVNMGLVAGDGGAVIWPLLVGPHRAKEYLMSGKLIPGPEAAAIGLVNRCIPDAKLLDEAIAYARGLAEGPQTAIRWTKLAINQHLWQSAQLALGLGLAVEHLSAKTKDQREAVAAWVEKRKPRFTGY